MNLQRNHCHINLHPRQETNDSGIETSTSPHRIMTRTQTGTVIRPPQKIVKAIQPKQKKREMWNID